MTEAKRFCVVTTGRCASAALFQSLERYNDIMTPTKQMGGGNRELLHDRDLAERCEQYSDLVGETVDNQDQLIKAFYQSNETMAYSGFKTLYNFVDDWEKFTQLDVQWIVLTRDDLASQIASFMLALKSKNWETIQTPAERSWSFLYAERRRIKAFGLEIIKHEKIIKQLPAIKLTYEQLAQVGFANTELNDYFGRVIQLQYPRSATKASDYVVNWDLFSQFVQDEILSQSARDAIPVPA